MLRWPLVEPLSIYGRFAVVLPSTAMIVMVAAATMANVASMMAGSSITECGSVPPSGIDQFLDACPCPTQGEKHSSGKQDDTNRVDASPNTG